MKCRDGQSITMSQMCLCLGHAEVCPNGLEVQISYPREPNDRSMTDGQVILIHPNGKTISDVDFMYSFVNPLDALEMAAEIKKTAEYCISHYEKNPEYGVFCDGELMRDECNGWATDFIFMYEDSAKKEAE